jgi:selenocysteine-specific elongation factor
MRRFLIGTAGHIDHGKSALVKALTGTDPDRLPEEKARGITIDLGFAHATWNDTVFSFVDVPGHEKFVRTMVAGAQGIDVVLLAVASDDSVMPQTREHLDIVGLLGITAGVIARTKSDLVDAETGALVEDEIRALVKGSFLEKVPLVAVSSVTLQGLDELKKALTAASRLVSRSGHEKRVTRLSLDRAFTMKGFGPVVTGTLDGGTIAVDDHLTLFPQGRDVRVRRIEVHGEERRQAFAGERTSLNLAGVERAELRRGQTLVARGALAPTSVLTVELTLLPSIASALPDGGRVRVHHGTADVGARLARIRVPGARGEDGPFLAGATVFAQVSLETPLAARLGDRFILRRPSPVETLGGGRILDTGRPKIRRPAADTPDILAVLARGDEAACAALFLREAGEAGLTAARLGQRLGIPAPLAQQRLDSLVSAGAALKIAPALYAHATATSSVAVRTAALFAERKKSGEASLSFSRSEFLEKLGRALPAASAEGWLATLQAGGRIVLEGDRVVEPGRRATDLSAGAAGFAARIAEAWRRAGFEPPKSADLGASLGTKPAVVEGLVAHLLKSGVFVRISPDLVVHKETADAAARKLEPVRGQTLTVGAFRDLLGLTRKTLIPLLEYFDAKKLTRRIGDSRRVE